MVTKNKAKMSQFINDVFGFDMGELDGDRLFTLYLIAKQWQDAGYNSPGERLKEKVISDTSLYDLLMMDELDAESIMFIGSKLQ